MHRQQSHLSNASIDDVTDAGNGVFTDNSHGLVVGDRLLFAFNTAPNISSGSTDSALLNTKILLCAICRHKHF